MTINKAFEISHGYLRANIDDTLLAEELILAYQNSEYRVGMFNFFSNNFDQVPYFNGL